MKKSFIYFCTMLVLVCFAGTLSTMSTVVYAQPEEPEEEPPAPPPDDDDIEKVRTDRLSWVNLQKEQALTTVKCEAIKNAKSGNSMRIHMSNIKAALESAKISEKVTVEFHFPTGKTKLGKTYIYKLGSYAPKITGTRVSFAQIPNARAFHIPWDPDLIEPASGQYNGKLVFKDEKGAVKAKINAVAAFGALK